MPRPLKQGILGASTIILSKDIDKYVFICDLNFDETDVFFLLCIYFFCTDLSHFDNLGRLKSWI